MFQAASYEAATCNFLIEPRADRDQVRVPVAEAIASQREWEGSKRNNWMQQTAFRYGQKQLILDPAIRSLESPVFVIFLISEESEIFSTWPNGVSDGLRIPIRSID